MNFKKYTYPRKLIFDYVSGNDINNFNIDDLENDYLFMIDVINYTRDKATYNWCSDVVKNNHEFVKFILTTFKDDINFIVKVADEYLEKINSDSIEFKEINILMGNILPKDSDHLMGYNLNTTIMSHQQMIFNYQLIDSITDAKLKQELGLGFNIIKDEYDGNTLILDFFAQKYLLEIFKESSDFSLEKLLHHNFTNFELLKEYGINNFLINYIRHKDIALANYLRTKNHLLNDLKKNVLLYGSNWLNFEKRNAHLKVELIIEQVSQIMDVNREEYHFDVMDIIYYTARKLGLEDKFREYEQSAFEDYDDYDFNQFMEECINFVDSNNMNFHEKACYHKVKKIMQEIFYRKVINEDDYSIDNYIKEEQYQTKVIPLTKIKRK